MINNHGVLHEVLTLKMMMTNFSTIDSLNYKEETLRGNYLQKLNEKKLFFYQ